MMTMIFGEVTSKESTDSFILSLHFEHFKKVTPFTAYLRGLI